MSKSFIPLSRDELRDRYGAFYSSSRTQVLNEAKVPNNLRALVPYAEIWGVADDLKREKLADGAPTVAQSDLIRLIDEFDSEFDEWLAGPEAESAEFSDEYIAFSAMRMARDYM